MRDRVRVAAATVDTKPGQLEANLEKLDRAAARAADDGAQLVLFPELSLSGFIPNHPRGDHEAWLRRALAEARRMAVRLDGPPVRALVEIAARTGAWISAGMLEDAGNVLYNTQLLVGPSGLAGHWRKLHVPVFEMPFYNCGDAPRVVETPLARIGANICFDF